jgi:hypothetical protein
VDSVTDLVIDGTANDMIKEDIQFLQSEEEEDEESNLYLFYTTLHQNITIMML